MKLDDFIDNNFFQQAFLRQDLPEYFNAEEAQEKFAQTQALWKAHLKDINEAALEKEFIAPVLEVLGYSTAYQVVKKAYGKQHKPDFALFANEERKNTHYAAERDDNTDILALCESKAYKNVLDTNKLNATENPHFQLLRYLKDLNLSFGFLTNGRYWRFYDVTENRADKVFYEINLERVLTEGDWRDFAYFYYIFRRDNFLPDPEETGTESPALPIQAYLEQSDRARRAVEDDLREVIYGKDSIIELIGQRLYRKFGNTHTIKDIYGHAVTFGFRLLFIAYFEDKFRTVLFQRHRYYKDYSLRMLVQLLEDKSKHPDALNSGWGRLKDLFKMLDEGREDEDIPLLNGGLFNPSKAPLLTQNRVLSNKDLRQIFDALLKIPEGESWEWRDFRTLKVEHIGNLYEGLLEFEFREVLDEPITFLSFRKGNRLEEGFYDPLDRAAIEAEANKPKSSLTISDVRFYQAGQIYLVSRSSNRKTTASYYTPEVFTDFMIKAAVDQALAQGKPLLGLKVLDNACGSGHFLLAALTYLTERAYETLDQNPELKNLLRTEKALIQENAGRYFPPSTTAKSLATNASPTGEGNDSLPAGEGRGGVSEIDEQTLLKRILLKKTIFGVDLNPFAIELTRLSLWLDTFILGTPLSFIEHHIKVGNALMGSSRKDFFADFEDLGLYREQLQKQFAALVEQLHRLSDLRDTKPEDVRQSKAIYQSLQPALNRLNRALHFHSFSQLIPHIYPKAEAKTWRQRVGQVAGSGSFEQEVLEGRNTTLVEEIEAVAERFSLFHFDVAFAEVFVSSVETKTTAGSRDVPRNVSTPTKTFHETSLQEGTGFDLIIGNPPWDKTKFAESDFFPRYRSSYRTLKQSEKKKLRENILEYPGVRAEYEAEKAGIQAMNAYFKAEYPLNRGAGDNNLFRLFLERNLRFLTPSGTLTYLTPSAWVYEDSSMSLRKHLWKHYRLRFFFQFENREKLFRDVDSRYKFALFQLERNPEAKQPVPVRFMAQLPHFLTPALARQLAVETFQETSNGERRSLAGKRLTPSPSPTGEANNSLPTGEGGGGVSQILLYPTSDIRLLSPEHEALFEVKAQLDLDIIRRAYARFQPLNPDYLDFRRELDMTNDKDLFQEEKGGMPLYEGKMIHQFDASFGEPQYWVREEELQERLRSKEVSRLVKEIYAGLSDKQIQNLRVKAKSSSQREIVRTLLGLSHADEMEQFVKFDYEYPRMLIRDVSSNTNERTLITSLVPPSVTYGHTLTGSVPKYYIFEDNQVKTSPVPKEKVLFVASIFNSFAIDYILRFLVDIHVSKSYLMRLPVPQPTDTELRENERYRQLWQNAEQLNSGALSEKAAQKLRLQNDRLVFELYGLSAEEVLHLTSETYFPVFWKKQGAYVRALRGFYEI